MTREKNSSKSMPCFCSKPLTINLAVYWTSLSPSFFNSNTHLLYGAFLPLGSSTKSEVSLFYKEFLFMHCLHPTLLVRVLMHIMKTLRLPLISNQNKLRTGIPSGWPVLAFKSFNLRNSRRSRLPLLNASCVWLIYTIPWLCFMRVYSICGTP